MVTAAWKPSQPHLVTAACSGTSPDGKEMVTLPHSLFSLHVWFYGCHLR